MILEQIVAGNKAELAEKKRRLPPAKMRQLTMAQPPPLSLTDALRGSSIRLLAEVKKASPSRGVICNDFRPVEIAQAYARNGAAAISVLTEPRHFQGSLDYLGEIKEALQEKPLPLLRKDFIFDPYQVYESRACGADGLLLIVAILTPEKLADLMGLSHDLRMDCLVEVHNEAEAETAVGSGARVIGINNRDLRTFNVDLATTERVRCLIPKDRVVVSESGIKSHDDVEKLKKWGVDAVLIGEALMAASDIGAKIKELL